MFQYFFSNRGFEEVKSGASQSSYNSKANEAPKLATNNKFAALRDWIGGAPTYFVAKPSWKANLRNFSAASPLKKSWKNSTLMCTASLKRGCYYNFITFSKQERLFYSKICYRCGYGNEINIKKRLILAVLNKKNKNCKAKNANWVFSVSVHLQNMEAKLAEYRAKKSAEQAVIERKSKIWNFFTLKFLRGDDENYATNEDALEENIEGEAY